MNYTKHYQLEAAFAGGDANAGGTPAVEQSDPRDGRAYQPTPELELAVNLALATGRPLLLRGHPGSGKSLGKQWTQSELRARADNTIILVIEAEPRREVLDRLAELVPALPVLFAARAGDRPLDDDRVAVLARADPENRRGRDGGARARSGVLSAPGT